MDVLVAIEIGVPQLRDIIDVSGWTLIVDHFLPCLLYLGGRVHIPV